VNFRSELADQNISGLDVLSAIPLNTSSLALLSRPFLELPPAFLCAIAQTSH
jgi:hypothetical protein